MLVIDICESIGRYVVIADGIQDMGYNMFDLHKFTSFLLEYRTKVLESLQAVLIACYAGGYFYAIINKLEMR